MTKPIANCGLSDKRFPQIRKYGPADCLLLAARMIFDEFVPGDVAGIHAGNSMVHQQLCIELRHAGYGRNSSEALVKIVAPQRLLAHPLPS